MSGYTTVLVGTDGSESSFRAVDRAAAVARDCGAKLVLAADRARSVGVDAVDTIAIEGDPVDELVDIVVHTTGRTKK